MTTVLIWASKQRIGSTFSLFLMLMALINLGKTLIIFIMDISRYPVMRDALQATGRAIFYSICEW